MLSTEEFKGFGDEAVLFLHVTSRFDGEPNPNLLMEKGGRGFPFFAVMDENGDVVAKHQGPRTVDGFRQTLRGSGDYIALRDKAAKGDAAAETEFLIKRIELGNLGYEDAVAARNKLSEVSDEQNAQLDQMLVDLEFQSIRDGLRSRDDLPVAGEKFVAMKKAGRIPEGRSAIDFWMIISFYAEQEKNVELFKEVIAALEDERMVAPRVKEQLKERLEKIQDS